MRYGVHKSKSSTFSSSSSLISSLLHSHVNLEWCDKIKLSNLLLLRPSSAELLEAAMPLGWGGGSNGGLEFEPPPRAGGKLGFFYAKVNGFVPHTESVNF